MRERAGMLTDLQLTFDLLRFALMQTVNSTGYKDYFFSENSYEKLPTPLEWGGTCLVGFQEKWAVYAHGERYEIGRLALHDGYTTAVDDFFWRVTAPKNGTSGIYRFRVKWERATGLAF